MYIPFNHYWIKSDGSIYSSRANAMISKDDAEYLAWRQFNTPTPWPKSDRGAETDAALADVLSPYGIILNIK